MASARKTAAAVFLVVVLACSQARSQDAGRAVPLGVGDPAPYAGVLIDDRAAAKIVADREASVARAQVEARKAMAEAQARWKLDYDRDAAEWKTDRAIVEARVRAAEDSATAARKLAASRHSTTTVAAVAGASAVVAAAVTALAFLFARLVIGMAESAAQPATEVVPKSSWIWIHDSSGHPSITVTFLAVAFWVTTAAYVLSIVEALGPLKIRPFDSAACGTYFIPLASLYFGRRFTDAKYGNPNVPPPAVTGAP